MKYVALLRGINVGGNNLISMLALKEVFEKNGFTNVRTYINSGNVIFESDEKNSEVITKEIANSITKTFKFDIRILIKSHDQIKKVVTDAPKEWKTKNDLRCYIGFLMDPVTAEEAIKVVKVREGIDSLKTSDGALYMTTLMSGRTKSAFNQLAGTEIYKNMTIRNYNTTIKILGLMEQ